MARCKHDTGNIQQFTERCLDCGRNIYETDQEYETSLKRDISILQSQVRSERIEKLEEMKESLLKELKKDDDNDSGW